MASIIQLKDESGVDAYPVTGANMVDGLANVAKTGSYNDLSNKPTIPTVPTISTNIESDGTSDVKTASPKAVKTFVEGKGYGTYSKPSGGIPASDLASGVIPTVPVISTDIEADKTSDTKTASAKAVYTQVSQLRSKVDGAITHTRNIADEAIRGDNLYINSSNSKVLTENGCLLIIFPCLGGTTYTMSKIKTTRFRIAYCEEYPANGVQSYGVITDNNATHLTITTGANATYIVAWVYNSSGESVTKDAVMASLQIELGAEATPYVSPVWSAVDLEARNGINNLDDSLTSVDAKVDDAVSQINRLETDLSSLSADYRKRDSSIYVGADIDAAWELVDGSTQSSSIQYNNVTRKNVRCATFVGPSNNGVARIRFSRSVNANLHPFLFSICIGDYSDIVNAPAGDVKLIFYSGSQTFDSSRAMKIPLQVATADQDYNTTFNRNGWVCLCAFLASYEGSGAEIGESFDPTNVTGFGVHLINIRNLPVTVHVERMDFLEDVMTKPGIVTVIDNFNQQVPSMADYAYSKGVRLNLSIIPGYYEGASGAPVCASKEELARLAAQGHFIWNHTWTHPNFNDITIPQIHDQINLAEKWMQLNGYGEGKRLVSIPSARFNTRSCNAALDTNVEMFFHSWVREKKQIYVPFAPVNRLLPITWLDSDALDAGESGADIAAVALKCLTYNGLAVMGFHGTYITNEGGGMQNWQDYIDTIAASDAYHYGLDEILEGGWN